MVKQRIRKKFGPGTFANKKIAVSLVKLISRIQKDLQTNENITQGRKASHITFLRASDELVRRSKK